MIKPDPTYKEVATVKKNTNFWWMIKYIVSTIFLVFFLVYFLKWATQNDMYLSTSDYTIWQDLQKKLQVYDKEKIGSTDYYALYDRIFSQFNQSKNIRNKKLLFLGVYGRETLNQFEKNNIDFNTLLIKSNYAIIANYWSSIIYDSGKLDLEWLTISARYFLQNQFWTYNTSGFMYSDNTYRRSNYGMFHKDKYSVYMDNNFHYLRSMWEKIPLFGVDAWTFEEISRSFYKDKQFVYYLTDCGWWSGKELCLDVLSDQPENFTLSWLQDAVVWNVYPNQEDVWCVSNFSWSLSWNSSWFLSWFEELIDTNHYDSRGYYKDTTWWLYYDGSYVSINSLWDTEDKMCIKILPPQLKNFQVVWWISWFDAYDEQWFFYKWEKIWKDGLYEHMKSKMLMFSK